MSFFIYLFLKNKTKGGTHLKTVVVVKKCLCSFLYSERTKPLVLCVLRWNRTHHDPHVLTTVSPPSPLAPRPEREREDPPLFVSTHHSQNEERGGGRGA